jgi:hypothetical protein
MPLDNPVFDIRHRIKYWINSLDDEQRTRLRRMNPEESLRSMLEGLECTPPLIGRVP